MRYDRGSQNQDLHGRLRTIAAAARICMARADTSLDLCGAR